MNKVASRCQKESCAKFFYSSQVMLRESKMVKLMAYTISIIPIVLSLLPIPGDKQSLVFATTMVSFGLTIFLEFISTFLSNHKEKSILLGQLYESEISGSTFSKIEYDREMTNDLNELAIRKSAAKMADLKEYHAENVPDEVEDKYSYLYICRLKSASTNYLMSRMYAIYMSILVVLITLFISIAFVKNNTFQFLQLIIQFYPLILPIIRNITSSRKTMRYCAKLSADIDNFFADGDDSTMRLARFIYYVQNIEFEMLMASPARYSLFYKIFNKGLTTLERGVTKRFISAEKGLYKLVGKPIPKVVKPAKKEETKQIKLSETSKKLAEQPVKLENTKVKTTDKKQSDKNSKLTKALKKPSLDAKKEELKKSTKQAENKTDKKTSTTKTKKSK